MRVTAQRVCLLLALFGFEQDSIAAWNQKGGTVIIAPPLDFIQHFRIKAHLVQAVQHLGKACQHLSNNL